MPDQPDASTDPFPPHRPALAVVTGATGTLGSALVARFAAAGLAVLAVSRSGDAVGAGESACLAADLGSDDAVAAIRDALPAGDLAIAVHAVGLPSAPGVLAVEPTMLARAVDLKAGGLLRLLHAVEDRLVTGSRLVAVGGHLGIEPTEHAPLAGVANAALANLVRQLTGPLGRRGASVHLVAPGPFESPRVEALAAAKASGRGVPLEQVHAEMAAEYPSGRLPSPDDVAQVIALLLDPAASVLNGSTLFADAGVRRGIF
ncbi:MAG: SDR family oxidoreductase [Kineosporiaceae bacterium]|nr:SDR family oxidoreductase [Kineosporiaceae bacterium]